MRQQHVRQCLSLVFVGDRRANAGQRQRWLSAAKQLG